VLYVFGLTKFAGPASIFQLERCMSRLNQAGLVLLTTIDRDLFKSGFGIAIGAFFESKRSECLEKGVKRQFDGDTWRPKVKLQRYPNRVWPPPPCGITGSPSYAVVSV